MNPKDFYQAWRFLEEHPIFRYQGLDCFQSCLDISVVKVNPVTETIDDKRTLNTETRIWIECGPWEKPEDLKEEARKHYPGGVAGHDIELDCGAPTFEEAITKLAGLVLKKYGSYEMER